MKNFDYKLLAMYVVFNVCLGSFLPRDMELHHYLAWAVCVVTFLVVDVRSYARGLEVGADIARSHQ